ncbi:hypothetical protein PSEUBRA_004279 [Kalmanozyma brasiliensis GHG001]|uniref:Uncharacterized protein n=1 Tax=Kalmanozyma brasiliensis (strain GHG001) TaxID=1365824 RepID=V5EMN3_KALBG|nr:uncharacterized protein PSEUBRA_004279 [Kalmanozyma brasiliensis GHG001]EST06385.1 hypothetical protein PSEUBRA_004279 [Kalmanozyma brasiliensis GHG001]
MMTSTTLNPAALKADVHLVTSPAPVIPTRTVTVTINGISTTVIAQSFTDRIFITVTQLSKFGCLYQASTSSNPAAPFEDGAIGTGLPPPLPTTVVSKLVGTEPSPAYTTLYQLYVSQIASIVKSGASGEDRPLVVSLALKTSPSAEKGRDEEDDEAEELLLTSEDERARFMAVMEAVQRCMVW